MEERQVKQCKDMDIMEEKQVDQRKDMENSEEIVK